MVPIPFERKKRIMLVELYGTVQYEASRHQQPARPHRGRKDGWPGWLAGCWECYLSGGVIGQAALWPAILYCTRSCS